MVKASAALGVNERGSACKVCANLSVSNAVMRPAFHTSLSFPRGTAIRNPFKINPTRGARGPVFNSFSCMGSMRASGLNSARISWLDRLFDGQRLVVAAIAVIVNRLCRVSLKSLREIACGVERLG
jgi:hypothetical protein